MIFNSLTYFVLLFSVVPLYWLLPKRPRLLLIFTSSLTFYAFWRVEFLPVMLFSLVVDYFIAQLMPGSTNLRKKRLLYVSLFANLGLLFYFKYLIFFAENVIGLSNILGFEIDPVSFNIILPLGISFYTFQTISYTVDVYRGLIKPEKNFLLYACYVTFFPQLVAGPVLRAVEVMGQLSKRPLFRWEDIVIGSRRIVYGLFLKVVLADSISPLVDTGFSMEVASTSALDVWTLAFLFGFQIYFDFSAYSHIALGSARLMGICFPENFNFPYVAISPKDFWRRWHISLSSWIRDYLYLPLAGIKVHDKSTGGLGNATLNQKKNMSLFTTWAVMGLWHGANWTFILWGIYHSIVIFVFRELSPFTRKLNHNVKALGGMALTLPIMMLAWIPFRTSSLADTFGMWAKVISPYAYTSLGMRENVYLVTAILLCGFFITFFVKNKLRSYFEEGSKVVFLTESFTFAVVIPLVIIFLRPINQFIYFQF